MTRTSLANLSLSILFIMSVWGNAEPGFHSFPAADERLMGSCRTTSQKVADRHYTLTARVRLLVLWINRPGVGAGRITWNEGDDGSHGLSLLIGSDPARAPMKINRWGYIVESVSDTCTEVVGVMTEAEEQSVEQARASVRSSNAVHSFKSIRSHIQGQTAHSTVSYLRLPEDFTFREVDTLLQRVLQERGRVRRIDLPEGVEPGFLFAVRSLVDESVDSFRRTGTFGMAKTTLRRYVFAGSAFEIRRRSTRVVREMVISGTTFRQLLESAFEARNLSNGQLSHFNITYGTEAPVAGIPVRIVYRPRWWFEAEMLLERDSAASQAVQGGTPWKSATN